MVSFVTPVSAVCSSEKKRDQTRNQNSRLEANQDDALVLRLRSGDQSAFAEIIERHRKRLFSVAFSRIWNRGDAEEIVQDTFIRAFRGLDKFRGDCSLATWLHHIAQNLAHNRYWYFHRRFRHATVSLDYKVGEDESSTLLDSVACDSAGPLRETVTREFNDLVEVCMQQLDAQQRTILCLTHTLSYAEIAQEIGINIGTVKSRIARARNRLHALLTAACPEFADGARPAAWLESTRTQNGDSTALKPR